MFKSLRYKKISAIKIVKHIKSNLDIDVSVSTVCNFIRGERYHGRVTRKKYFNLRKDCNSRIIMLAYRWTVGIERFLRE